MLNVHAYDVRQMCSFNEVDFSHTHETKFFIRINPVFTK